MNKYSFLFLVLLAVSSCKSTKQVSVSKSVSNIDKPTRQKVNNLFMDAEKAKVTEDFDTAVKGYREALKLDPNNSDCHFQLAQILLGQNKNQEANEEASAAVKLDPSNKWYAELYANTLTKLNMLKEAMKVYESLIANHPGNPDYYFDLAYLQLTANQPEEALKTYNSFEKNYGIDESVILQKEKIYLKLNKFEDAMRELQKLVDAYPGEVQYLQMQAQLYLANNKKDKAQEVYNQILKLEPDNAEALLASASLNYQNGDTVAKKESLKKIFANPKVDIDAKIKILFPYIQFFELKKDNKTEAFELAEILTKTHPDQAKAFAIKGDLYFLDNQLDTALSAYLKALELQKDVFTVWQQVLFIYNSKRDWQKLLNTANDALELFPNQSVIYLLKGGAEQQLKDYEKAVKSYSKGEKMAGDNSALKAQFLSSLGDTYNSLNKFTESDSSYEKALKLDPDNANMLNNYSYYLSIRNVNLEKAKEMSAYSNKLAPNNDSYLDTYAWILFRLKDYRGAKEWQEKAMKVNGDKSSGTLLEHYGDILYQLGDKTKAIEYWKKAKDAGADSTTLPRKIAEEKYVE